MKLPESFIQLMKDQLKEEWPDFLATYDQSPVKGIRVNTLKISVEDFKAICPFKISPVPWTRNGFYLEEDVQAAKHPFYFAGLYYIQEPSAMLPAEVLDPQPGQVVLDLCAAPGGKTMQLADMMEDQGLIIANDLNNHRLKALLRNAELMGLKNLVVLNDHQKNIGPGLSKTIDRLLIDAPCSGEGMFKKHDEATSAYAAYDISACRDMQEAILDEIIPVLKTEGKMVYSTCTFNPYENEQMMTYVQEKHALSLVEIPSQYGFQDGLDMPEVVRLYPHHVRGEGHFVAAADYQGIGGLDPEKRAETNPPEALKDFMDTYMNKPLKGHFKVKNNHIFLLPDLSLPMKGIKVVKEGWYIGKLNRDRFEPSLAFALGLKADDFKQVISFSSDSEEVVRYLKCETVFCDGNKGYNLVCVEGYPLGWAKWHNKKLKNLYPPAWRLS